MAEEEYSATGLSPSHALLLLSVNAKQGIQPKEIAIELQLTPSTVTRLMDKLELRKYITREDRGKTVRIFSTARGKALDHKIKNAWLRLYKRYSAEMQPSEGKKITRWIYQMARKLD